jgi:hypothetical protein
MTPASSATKLPILFLLLLQCTHALNVLQFRQLRATQQSLLLEQSHLLHQLRSTIHHQSTNNTFFSPFKTIHPIPYCKRDNMYCEKENNHKVLIPCEETLYMNEQLESCRDSFIKCATSWSKIQSTNAGKKYPTTARHLRREWKQPLFIKPGPDDPSPDQKVAKIFLPPQPPKKRPLLPHKVPTAAEMAQASAAEARRSQELRKEQGHESSQEKKASIISSDMELPKASGASGAPTDASTLRKSPTELSKQRTYQNE